jgi:hypothetical protein
VGQTWLCWDHSEHFLPQQLKPSWENWPHRSSESAVPTPAVREEDVHGGILFMLNKIINTLSTGDPPKTHTHTKEQESLTKTMKAAFVGVMYICSLRSQHSPARWGTETQAFLPNPRVLTDGMWAQVVYPLLVWSYSILLSSLFCVSSLSKQLKQRTPACDSLKWVQLFRESRAGSHLFHPPGGW